MVWADEIGKRRELAGFLLPGIIHEFRNLLNRVNLLTEMTSRVSSLAEIRHEIHSPDTEHLYDMILWLTVSAEDLATARLRDLGKEEISVPGDFEPLFRVLRSSARKAGISLTIEEINPTTVTGSGIEVSIRLCRAVYEVCTGNGVPDQLELSFRAETECRTSSFLLASERGIITTVEIGA